MEKTLDYKFDVGTPMTVIRECYDTVITFGGIEAATCGVIEDGGVMKGRISIILQADATPLQIFAIGCFIGYFDATMKKAQSGHN